MRKRKPKEAETAAKNEAFEQNPGMQNLDSALHQVLKVQNRKWQNAKPSGRTGTPTSQVKATRF